MKKLLSQLLFLKTKTYLVNLALIKASKLTFSIINSFHPKATYLTIAILAMQTD